MRGTGNIVSAQQTADIVTNIFSLHPGYSGIIIKRNEEGA